MREYIKQVGTLHKYLEHSFHNEKKLVVRLLKHYQCHLLFALQKVLIVHHLRLIA